jgi:hypothetical protein
MSQRRGKSRKRISTPAVPRRQSPPPAPRGRRPTWRYWLAMLGLAIFYQLLFIVILHRNLTVAIGVLIFMGILVLMADRAFNLGRFFFK